MSDFDVALDVLRERLADIDEKPFVKLPLHRQPLWHFFARDVATIRSLIAEHASAQEYAERMDAVLESEVARADDNWRQWQGVARERDAARAERDELLEAVGRAMLPELNGGGHKAYPWVKTAVREIERLGLCARCALPRMLHEQTDVRACGCFVRRGDDA